MRSAWEMTTLLCHETRLKILYYNMLQAKLELSKKRKRKYVVGALLFHMFIHVVKMYCVCTYVCYTFMILVVSSDANFWVF